MMFRNNLKVALRNLLRHKSYACINIIGLAVGLAICILIFQYVYAEMSYDRFHEHAKNLYRFQISRRNDAGEWNRYSLSPIPLAPVLEEQFPEILYTTRLMNRSTIVKANGNKFNETLLFTDPDFFSIFSFELLKGSRNDALANKYSVVISASAAIRYFGTTDVLGKALSVRRGNEFHDLPITGVCRDVPSNSTIKFDILLPSATLLDNMDPIFKESWGAMTVRTYIRLADGADPASLENKLPLVFKTRFQERYGDEVDKVLESHKFSLQPLTAIHLNPQISDTYEPVNNPVYLHILIAIGAFILILACINVTNLAIGQAATRFHEMGTRRIMGAGRFGLIIQFLGESMILSFISLALALVLAELSLPIFNRLASANLNLAFLNNAIILPALICLAILVALMAGGYPALYLTHFRPANILRGTARIGRPGLITKALVVLQFSLSIFFIICTLMISRQLDYMKSKNLGFDQDHIVMMPIKSDNGARILELMKEELSSHSSIKSVTGCGESLGRVSDYGFFTTEVGEIGDGSYAFRIDNNYLETMGIKLVEGRNFSSDFPGDSTHSIIVNQAFADKFGLQSPLGEKVNAHFGGLEDGIGEIIGVVENFNFLSLHTDIEPALFHISPRHSISYIAVKVNPEKLSTTLKTLQAAWVKVAPDLPFEYYFLDDDFNRQYQAEERWSMIFGYSSFFAILIASFGLLGITALALSRRTKEIGIRKVLGATVQGIVRLVTGDFLLLVLIANLLAWPAAFYAMHTWMQNFAYKSRLGPEIFVFSALLALGIAFITASYQAVKAALANPVDSLRQE
jgi:putative ABC transport system permease protein